MTDDSGHRGKGDVTAARADQNAEWERVAKEGAIRGAAQAAWCGEAKAGLERIRDLTQNEEILEIVDSAIGSQPMTDSSGHRGEERWEEIDRRLKQAAQRIGRPVASYERSAHELIEEARDLLAALKEKEAEYD